MCNYLTKREATYYFRRVIPDDLQPVFGRKEWVYSLRTKHRDEGKRRALAGAIETTGLIDEARAKLAAGSPAGNPKARTISARKAAPQHWVTDDEIEAMEFFEAEADRREYEYGEREAMRQQITRQLQGSTASLSEKERAIRDILRDHTARARDLEEELANANRRLWAAKPIIPQAAADSPTPTTDRGIGTQLSFIVDKCSAERGVTPKTKDASTAVVRWFQQRVGNIAVEHITRKDVLDFKDKLLADGTSAANANVKLGRLAGLLSWAYDNEYASSNPAKGVRVPNPTAAKDRKRPFDLPALTAIFSSPVYAEGARPVGGKGEAAYWLPLLSLYTAARLEELAQLRPTDVVLETYHDAKDVERTAWVIKIREDAEAGLRLKNAGSERDVPLHSVLQELGFIAFVQAAGEAHQTNIFPSLKANKYGTLSAKWGEWFGPYLRHVCHVTDKRMTFHSFRHLWKDNARHAGIVEGVQRQIMGHTGKDVADDYGSGYSLHQVVEAMAVYRVPGFNPPRPASV